MRRSGGSVFQSLAAEQLKALSPIVNLTTACMDVPPQVSWNGVQVITLVMSRGIWGGGGCPVLVFHLL